MSQVTSLYSVLSKRLSVRPTETELPSLLGINNIFTSSSLVIHEGILKMANCPECGKPLRKENSKSMYCCENNACSVIFVRHPDSQSMMEIKYDASAPVKTRKR